MADSLNMEGKEKQTANAPLPERPVPTFDPISPGGRMARWALLLASLATLACLLAAIISEHYLKPWRVYQREFASLLTNKARAEGKNPPAFKQEIKQITSYSMEVSDRCITCHLGFDDPSLSAAPQPFRTHPEWVVNIHPVEKFGCTPCHGGQGLATTVEDAHGRATHWEDPLIPAGFYQAGCGSCHTHLKVTGGALGEYGARLLERNDCLACHRINGRGRGNGPDLSTIGTRPFRGDWHERHLLMQRESDDEAWRLSYGPLDADEILAINTYLDQLVGAPELVQAKATVYAKGCLGCHRINGVGGDDGVDLTNAGRKNPNHLDYTNVEGTHDLAGWHRAHLLAPAKITPGSKMPQPALTNTELTNVTLFLLSLRGADSPMSRWPADRLEAERLGVREFATDGESLFKAFCSACHGEDGMGTRFGNSPQAFPSIAHPEFLAIASDRFVRRTLMDGRPGSRMPAWGVKEGGLRPEEVDAVVAYLRSLSPTPPSWEAVSTAATNPELGARLYRDDCAVCHGRTGEGASGPALANQVFLRTVEPQFIYRMLADGREDTAMGSYRHYSADQMASLLKYVQGWQKGSRINPSALPTIGSSEAGRAIYARSCAPCHGDRGLGALAVNIVNPGLLEAASDAFLASAVKLGRCVPPEESQEDLRSPDVTDQELADVIAYLRDTARYHIVQPPGKPVSGDPANGKLLFAGICAGCHGETGKGGTAPALAGAALGAAATDGYLQATIVRGRPSGGMPAFGGDNMNFRKLEDAEVGDIVRYIRTLELNS